jgi:ELWxxDGT repeat protein
MGSEAMATDAGNTRKKARRISVGTSTTITESLNRADKDDFFRFVVGARSSFDAQLSAIPRKSNYDFEIQRQNGTVIASSKKPNRQPENLNLTLEGGTYFIRVNQRKGKGNYNLQLSLNADNAGDTFATAQAITVEATPTAFTDFVGVSDPNDFYRFTVGAPSLLNVSLNQLTAGATVTLFDANQNPLLTSSGSGAAPATLQGTFNSGTYFLRIAPEAGAKTTYNLTVEADLVPDQAGQDFASATGLNVGTVPVTVTDSISGSDPADFYQFNATTLGELQINLTGLTPTADLDVILYDANQGVLAFQGGTGAGGNEQILVNIPQIGIYYIAVVPASPGNSSAYTLSAALVTDQAGQNFATATNLNVGFTPVQVSDSVSDNDPSDFYQFNATTLGSLQIDLTGLAATADLDVVLYDPTQTVVSSRGGAGAGGNEQILADLSQLGVYYIEVKPASPGNRSPYTLGAVLSPGDNFGDSTVDATLLTAPGTSPFPVLSDTPNVYSDFVGEGDIDVFKLVFDQPRNFLSVNLTGLTANLDVKLYVEGNADTSLLSNSGGTTEESFIGNLGPGTYYLEIIPGESGASSTYNLELSVSPNSNVPTITRDVNPNGNANARALTDVNGTLFFIGQDGTPANTPVGLWKSQGTLDTTVKVGSFTNIEELAAIDSNVYFSAGSAASGTELWKWDSSGSSLGTLSQVAEIAPGTLNSSPGELTVAENNLYFIATATGEATGKVLYRLDSSGVPVAIAAAGDVPEDLTYVQATDTLYYRAGISGEGGGDRLWKIEGAGSANPSAPVNLSTFGSAATSPRFVTSLQAVGSDLFFLASTESSELNTELRRVDSTGAFFTYDANGDGVEPSIPGIFSGVAVVQDSANVSYAYFQASDTNGEELFRANLATGAIEELDQITTGSFASPSISNFKVYNNKLYFSANNGANGTELWVTDPNATNPLAVSQIEIFSGDASPLNPNSSSPTNLITVAGKLYFSATGLDGRELYSIDSISPGSTGLPTQVVDINVGAGSSDPEDLIAIGDLSGTGTSGTLYFTADNGVNGREVWTA